MPAANFAFMHVSVSTISYGIAFKNMLKRNNAAVYHECTSTKRASNKPENFSV